MSGFKPIVNKTKCNGCRECKKVCPVDVFIMSKKTGKVIAKRWEDCIGCESCVEVCVPGAIKIKDV